MTNHPNRGRRRRWSVDLAACTVARDDGWAFRCDWPALVLVTAGPLAAGTRDRDLPGAVRRIADEARWMYEDTVGRAHEIAARQDD